ncbi:uncharacterized protein isoform X2 [Takifugu rubripes]|uniref:uncharacterized protein isoform X2 n=1 Tax=Takifugu rubripes TaxID=31033 RepID=UPI001145C1C1|nr:uncharacterized protein LOC101065915 isoform X2 [Takifugu rubripes]XP_029705722.1 uncharacterized protein LOC115253041 isoform X2 [Takifugu rubripes]
MGHLFGSGWLVFLIAFVKLEAQNTPPASVDSRCLGNVLSVDVSLLGGRYLEVEAVLNDSTVVITPKIASQCGLRMTTSPLGNTVIFASLQNCFAQNSGDVDFTTILNLRLIGSHKGDEVYQVAKTCRYAAWASREIICNSDYMEVSVRRPASNDYALPQQSVPGSQMGRATQAGLRVKYLVLFTPEEKIMEVTEAQNLHMITTTPTRLFLRTSTTSSETFTQDVSGVTMAVLKTSIIFANRWIDATAACPTPEGSVFFMRNSIRWLLPWYINPLISGQVQLLEVHVGINGSRLEPAEVAARQYSLTVGEVYVILDIPFGSVGGHFKSFVRDNKYYTSYQIEPMLELLWTEDAMHKDTRYKVFLPVTTPQQLQPIYLNDYTVPEKQFFDLMLGYFGPDVCLINISIPTGVLSVEECNARDFNILEHTFPDSSSKFFTLQVPFADPSVQQKGDLGKTVVSLHLTFGLLVMPELVPFSHSAYLHAEVADVGMQLSRLAEPSKANIGRPFAVSPSISGGCDEENFYILVKYGTRGLNFATTVGKQMLTSSLAREYYLMENGTHLSFSVPFSSSNVAYEAVQATSIRSRLDVTLTDPQTKKSLEGFSLSCTFIKTLTECFPNGTMTALAVKLESVPSLNPSQLVLNDPSCGPAYSDDRYAYFVFTANSCGTNRKFFANMMLYENEISLPGELEMEKSDDEPEYELKVYCYYDINDTYAVAFNTRARRSEPYADDAQGELQVEIRVASDDAYAAFHTEADYPVLKFLQEPVYFEVELKGTKLAAVSLELDSCWATLDGDRFSQPRWNLIIKGCVNPVDPNKVIFHPVPVDQRVHYPSHFKRFEVQMFAFADEDNLSHQVFVHCDVFVCDAKNPQDGVCNKLCYEKETGKGQKRAASDDRTLLHVISGPILVI